MSKMAQPARSWLAAPRRAAWLSLLLLLGGPVLAPPSLAQPASPAQALQEATKKSKQIEAVTGSKPAARVPAGDPCAIVAAADVKKVFPTATAAPERSRRLEEYGITECVWKSKDGQILLGTQESIAKSATRAREEALGMAQGFVDPLKRESLDNVRIVTFGAPGIDNAAFVETSNPARGILSDAAFLALVKGDRVVTLMAPSLPARDRGDALKALESLGAAAAKSMQ